MSGLGRFEKWAAILAAVAVAAAAVAVLLANDSTASEREAAQLEQRAWLAVSELALDQEPIDGQMMNVRVSLENQGRSPAVDVTARVRLVLGSAMIDDWDAAVANRYDLVLPGTAAPSFYASLLIGPGTMALYHAGQQIWISGRITYSDVFGQPHWMTFCGHHSPQQNLTLFTLCETGNDADRER